MTASQSQPVLTPRGVNADAEPSAAREPCDRAAILIGRMQGGLGMRAGLTLTQAMYDELAAHIRIALDTEVQAGGPYLNNGWNRLKAESGDLWWIADDGESGFGDPYEAYEAATDYCDAGSCPIELCRARSLPRVWAAQVVLTRDEDGEPDDTEIRCFNTKAEADAALGASTASPADASLKTPDEPK